jgi:hypothetical protein
MRESGDVLVYLSNLAKRAAKIKALKGAFGVGRANRKVN